MLTFIFLLFNTQSFTDSSIYYVQYYPQQYFVALARRQLCRDKHDVIPSIADRIDNHSLFLQDCELAMTAIFFFVRHNATIANKFFATLYTFFPLGMIIIYNLICTVNSRFRKDVHLQIHLHNTFFWTTGFQIQLPLNAHEYKRYKAFF